jgi:hypothetical protein
MRVLFAGVVVLAMGTGACALIAGLGDYEGAAGGGSDSSQSRIVKDSGVPVSTTDDSNDPPLIGEAAASEDTPDGDVGGDSPFIVGSDPGDAMLMPDVDTVCSTMTCPGCCDNGQCVGGQSVATCGVGGGSCKDCTSMGGACTNGSCTTVVADAGPAKTCTISKCMACIPVYQSACCKSDETCGCKTNFGGNGQCN